MTTYLLDNSSRTWFWRSPMRIIIWGWVVGGLLFKSFSGGFHGGGDSGGFSFGAVMAGCTRTMTSHLFFAPLPPAA
jgi:hypothetical protein